MDDEYLGSTESKSTGAGGAFLVFLVGAFFGAIMMGVAFNAAFSDLSGEIASGEEFYNDRGVYRCEAIWLPSDERGRR